MNRLSLTDFIYPNRDYIFEYSTPLLNPIVNNESLRSYLNLKGANFFFISEVKVFGTIKLNIRFSQENTVKNYANWIDDLIDYQLWGNTDFISAYEGDYSYTGQAMEAVSSVTNEIKGLLIPVAIIVVGGLILWKKL